MLLDKLIETRRLLGYGATDKNDIKALVLALQNNEFIPMSTTEQTEINDSTTANKNLLAGLKFINYDTSIGYIFDGLIFIPVPLAGAEAPVLSLPAAQVLVKYIGTDFTYYCEAAMGSLKNQAVWTITRIHNTTKTVDYSLTVAATNLATVEGHTYNNGNSIQ